MARPVGALIKSSSVAACLGAVWRGGHGDEIAGQGADVTEVVLSPRRDLLLGEESGDVSATALWGGACRERGDVAKFTPVPELLAKWPLVAKTVNSSGEAPTCRWLLPE